MSSESKGDAAVKANRILAYATVLLAVTSLVGPFFAAKYGARGKARGFESLPTSLQLDGTRWKVSYEDLDSTGNVIEHHGHVDFEQFGNRVIGEGRSSDENRTWAIEGATSAKRLVYIYIDTDINVTSFGSVRLEMNSTGDQLSGTWSGWSPLGLLQEQRATLKKLSSPQ